MYGFFSRFPHTQHTYHTTTMLKYVNHDIVFQEFPDEVTLAVNLSQCPNACPGCHSMYLWGDEGERLSLSRLRAMTEEYAGEITCVALMGGDNDPESVLLILSELKLAMPGLKTGWYSGHPTLPRCFNDYPAPDYVKLGPWREELGPLSSPTTNQRMYRYHADGKCEDITERFWKKGLKSSL